MLHLHPNNTRIKLTERRVLELYTAPSFPEWWNVPIPFSLFQFNFLCVAILPADNRERICSSPSFLLTASEDCNVVNVIYIE